MKSLLKPIFIFVCLQLGSVCSDDQKLKELCSQKLFDRITVDRTPVETTKKRFILYKSLTNTSETHLWKVMAEKDSERSSDKTLALKPVSIEYELNSE